MVSRQIASVGFLALTILALACAREAAANVFVADRRVQRDADRPPYRSVGVLHHARLGAGGTAFLVSSCHIATAYHVAFLRSRDPATDAVELGPPQMGHAAEFLVGADPRVPRKFAARTRARVVAFGRFRKSRFEGMAGDWAILRLDDCLGEKFGYLRWARDSGGASMPDGELMTLGFPRSRAARPGITVETGCRARDHGPIDGLVGIDCAFDGGMSGGPVLELQGDGSWLVVGIVQQSMSPVPGVLPGYTMEHRNQMVSVSVFRKALDDAFRDDARRLLARPARRHPPTR
ncbi:MAG TPA: trypsin-like peptidase domain-containing protein [Candidatus Binatia bacterium]|nr:trypsin-like peptidase domain-containing protein [Candidatus Binatia bacterium]